MMMRHCIELAASFATPRSLFGPSDIHAIELRFAGEPKTVPADGNQATKTVIHINRDDSFAPLALGGLTLVDGDIEAPREALETTAELNPIMHRDLCGWQP
jgi:hypothetical protein